MRVSPFTVSPDSSSARSRTFWIVDGRTRPRDTDNRPELFDRPREVAGALRQSREKKIPYRVAIDPRALIQTMLQQVLEVRVAIGQREQTVARIAGRQHAQLLSKTTGASSIVGDGDDPRDRVGIPFTLLRRELRQPLQDRG